MSTDAIAVDALEAIQATDPEIADLIRNEEVRQADSIRLIASENYTSKAVMQATGSVLTNKYSEGYPGKRYYEGQEYIDQIEQLAIDRAKSLFKMDHANVQPLSGSPANQAVYMALLEPGDKVMGMHLSHGGHLTHGWKVNFSGRLFDSVQYTVSEKDHCLDYEAIREMAIKEKPKMIWAGISGYPRIVDFEKFGAIAKEVGAYLIADVAHISGLVITGNHPDPSPHVDVITTTTHKTLRGPRGGMFLCKEEHATALDKAVFPCLQGGPHNHTTAAIAVSLKEAGSAEYAEYCGQIIKNAKALAAALQEESFKIVTGGTDNHLMLVDVTPKGLGGRDAAAAMNKAAVVCNSNAIPFDPRKPWDPSGLRIGTPAVTSRGMKEEEMKTIAKWISEILADIKDEGIQARVKGEVKELCDQFPAPGIAY